jgi:hypothetical protein
MRDHELIVVALAVALAGCPLGTTTTTTTTTLGAGRPIASSALKGARTSEVLQKRPPSR